MGFLKFASICCIILVLFIIVFISKMTKKVLKKLKELEEKQDEFLKQANHEIKTPLSIIMANTTLLEEKQGKTEETSNIKVQVKKLDKILSDLHQISVIENTEFITKDEKHNLSHLSKYLSKNFKYLAESQNKELVLDIKENVFVKYDYNDMKLLIYNLLENAIKFSPINEKIYFSLDVKKNEIILKFSNECNINYDDAEIKKMFDMFYRADIARATDVLDGAGLGLPMVKLIVEKYNGKIDIEKFNENGLTFIVKFKKNKIKGKKSIE